MNRLKNINSPNDVFYVTSTNSNCQEITLCKAELLLRLWNDNPDIERIASEESIKNAVSRGVRWLILKTDQGALVLPSPSGLYFARLWYCEDLYPLIFSLAALTKAQKLDDGIP